MTSKTTSQMKTTHTRQRSDRQAKVNCQCKAKLTDDRYKENATKREEKKGEEQHKERKRSRDELKFEKKTKCNERCKNTKTDEK